MKKLKKELKKKLNKKGFTLVELLVAITILGIIILIAWPQVNNLKNMYNKAQYKKYADSIITSAKLYVDSYSEDMFGYNTSGCSVVDYDMLKQKNLIKDIKISGDTCATNNTFVIVRKSNNHYLYDLSIYCHNDDKEVYSNILNRTRCDEAGPDEAGPTISFYKNGSNWTKGNGLKTTIQISDDYGMLENVKIKYVWEKDGVAISTPAEHNFKNKRYDGITDEPLELSLQAPQNATGKYTLKVMPVDVRDANGNYQIINTVSKEFKLDNTPPTCGTNNGNSTWTNQTLTIGVDCTDEGSGCSKTKYEKEYSSGTTQKDSVTLKDAVGNQATCTYDVYVDKDVPTKPTVAMYKWKDNATRPTSPSGLRNYTNDSWTNQYVYITGTDSTDAGGSGVKEYKIKMLSSNVGVEDQIFTTSGAYWVDYGGQTYFQYRACDYAGNCTDSDTKIIKIDTVAPDVPTVTLYKWADNSTAPTSTTGLSVYTPNTWSNKKIYAVATLDETITGSGKAIIYNQGSGKSTSRLKKGSTAMFTGEGKSGISFRACDPAGNCSNFTDESLGTALIDLTAPSGLTISMYKWNDNSTTPTSTSGLLTYTAGTKSNKFIYTTASATDSTSGGVYYNYQTSGAIGSETGTSATKNINKTGTSYIKYRACDVAGNCTDYTNNTTIVIESTIPINEKRYSGCDEYYITTCTSNGICTYTMKNDIATTGTILQSSLSTTYDEKTCTKQICSYHFAIDSSQVVRYYLSPSSYCIYSKHEQRSASEADGYCKTAPSGYTNSTDGFYVSFDAVASKWTTSYNDTHTANSCAILVTLKTPAIWAAKSGDLEYRNYASSTTTKCGINSATGKMRYCANKNCNDDSTCAEEN